MANHLFISYKHVETSSQVALKFYEYLSVVAGGLDFTVFMDQNIGAAELWSDRIEQELDKTTHFVCMLTTEYWLAEQCRRELFYALEKFENGGTPKILFVLVDKLKPSLLKVDNASRKAKLTGDNPGIRFVGDINFLGPFDQNLQLVRLKHDNPATLKDQFSQLVDRIEEVL